MNFNRNFCLIIETICLLLLSSDLLNNVNANTFQWNDKKNQDISQWQRNAQQQNAVCVDIPSNLTLCQGIGYTKMRLPNLLNHDTLREVSQQSNSWVPLSQLNCHPDTQLFLCSLFSPVCLDHPIPPCRSLCHSVQTSCEHVMLNYGYPWPKIVECHQFPIDNDMCIQAQHSPPAVQTLTDKKPITSNQHTDNKHRKGHKKGHGGKKQRRNQSVEPVHVEEFPPAIKETVYEPQPGHLQLPTQLDSQTRMKEEPQVDQALTSPQQTTERPARKWNKEQRQLFNDIINNFCRSQWILKARIYPINVQRPELRIRNYRLIQGSIQEQQTQPLIVLNANRTVVDSVLNQQTPEETQAVLSRRRYFIIGKTEENGQNWVTFIMQWPHKSAQLRKAIKAINNGDYDCQTADNSQQMASQTRDPKDRHNREKSRRNSTKDKSRVTPKFYGKKSKFITPMVLAQSGQTCALRFFYYMFGANVGSLHISVRYADQSIKSKANPQVITGNQGQQWVRAIYPYSDQKAFQFVIEGQLGNGPQSDIAIDDISFSEGCAPSNQIPIISSTTTHSSSGTVTPTKSVPIKHKSKSEPKKSNGGKIAAGVLVPVFIIGAILGFLFYRRHKQRQNEEDRAGIVDRVHYSHETGETNLNHNGHF